MKLALLCLTLIVAGVAADDPQQFRSIREALDARAQKNAYALFKHAQLDMLFDDENVTLFWTVKDSIEAPKLIISGGLPIHLGYNSKLPWSVYEALYALLDLHVVSGVWDTKALLDAKEVSTLLPGSNLTFSQGSDGKVLVQSTSSDSSATILGPNITAGFSMLHVLDRPLYPYNPPYFSTLVGGEPPTGESASDASGVVEDRVASVQSACQDGDCDAEAQQKVFSVIMQHIHR